MPHKQFKTALALSGGSARALTHLGVIEELRKNGIQIDLIVGTSMGAIIGALYAYYGSVIPVLEKMKKLLGSELFLKAVSVASEEVPKVAPESVLNRFVWLFRKSVYYTHSILRPTLVSEETYLQIMSELIPEYAIENLTIPFAAVTMDLLNGEEIVLTKGSLLKAVSASSAIPGILPAVKINGRTLVDGGWVDNVPVAPAIAMGGAFVMGVDASLDLPRLGPLPPSAVENFYRCCEVSRINLTRHRKACADIMLTPEVGELYWANFGALEPCLAAGRKAVSKNLNAIRRSLRMRRLQTLGGTIHPARRCDWRHPFTII